MSLYAYVVKIFCHFLLRFKLLDTKTEQLQNNLVQEAKIADLEKQVQLLQSNIISSKSSSSPKEQRQQNNPAQEAKIAELEKQVRFLEANKNNASNKVADQEMAVKIKYLNIDLRSVIQTNLALTKDYEALKKTNQELRNQLQQSKN